MSPLRRRALIVFGVVYVVNFFTFLTVLIIMVILHGSETVDDSDWANVWGVCTVAPVGVVVVVILCWAAQGIKKYW